MALYQAFFSSSVCFSQFYFILFLYSSDISADFQNILVRNSPHSKGNQILQNYFHSKTKYIYSARKAKEFYIV